MYEWSVAFSPDLCCVFVWGAFCTEELYNVFWVWVLVGGWVGACVRACVVCVFACLHVMYIHVLCVSSSQKPDEEIRLLSEQHSMYWPTVIGRFEPFNFYCHLRKQMM